MFISSARSITANTLRAVGALVLTVGGVAAQENAAATCPKGQRLEAKFGFESFDCDGCKLRRDPATGIAYVEFTKPPVIRGVGSTGALRDGDLLTEINGASILSAAGAKQLATLRRDAAVRVTVRRDRNTVEANITPEYACRASTGDFILDYGSGWGVKRDSLANFPSNFTFSNRGDSLVSNWTPYRLNYSFDTLALKHFNTNTDSGFWARSYVNTTRFARPNQKMALPNVWQSFNEGRNTQPQGWFGFSLGCDDCSFGATDQVVYRARARQDAPAPARLWRFSKNPQIVSVDSGGPAFKAGLLVGDVITGIDRFSMTSVQGGERFSGVQPGDTVQLQYTRGSDANRTVRLVAAQHPTDARVTLVNGADVLLRSSAQFGNTTVEISGNNITVTEDPKTGERTITGTNVKIVVKPPK